MVITKSAEHSSSQHNPKKVDDLESAQHLKPSQQQATAAMDKAKRNQQRATAENRSCRGKRLAAICGPAEQQQRHHQAEILIPLPAGKKKVRTAKSRLIVSKARIEVPRSQKNH